MSRLAKQIFIALIFISIISLLSVAGFYIFRDKNSGVVVPEKPKLDNLSLIKIKAVKTGDNNYDLIARIRNPNPNYGAKSFSYSFVFVNESGESIEVFDSQSYILPLETKYVIIPNAQPKEPGSELKFKINNIEWAELSGNLPSLPIFEKDPKFGQLDDGQEFASFKGAVLNKGLLSHKEVDVVLVVFDEADEIVTINFTKLAGVAAGEKMPFTLIWSEPFEGKPIKFDVQAYANPF